MAEIVRMPLLSDTMKEGVIAEWHKKVGDKVLADDVIADVETDKATMEVMPYVDGTLLYISDVKAIPVNGIMAIIGEEGEDISGILAGETTATADNNTTSITEAPAPVAEESATANTTNEVPELKDATVVQMPLLSDTMKEGKIVAWLKEIGDAVASDDVIAEVETDKATMEVMPYADGVLLYKGVEAGGAVPVNGIMAIVGKAGTDVTAYVNAMKNGGSDTPKTASAPKEEPVATPAPVVSAPTSQVSVVSTPVVTNSDDSRVKVSPLAKKIAQDKGIDLSTVKGTGDGGRIIKKDIDSYVPQVAQTVEKSVLAPIVGAPVAESYTDTPVSQMRNVIARRLSESKFNAPHFYLKTSVKMDKAMEARTAMNEVSESKISFNDLIIKASAMALRKHPAINSSWMGDFIRTNHHINIGTAVAVPEGLLVPVIKGADFKPLSEIAAEAKSLVKKARDKKLQPIEFSGNTFTISNLGMMDIDEFTAIINAPDSCILAVGKIEPTPVVENNEIVIRQILKLTLSCDHRVVDGATGAEFLKTLKTYLENPVTMLV